MPIIDIIDRPSEPPPLSAEEKAWMTAHPGQPLIRYIDNDSTRRLSRAILSAQTSKRAGGVLPEAKGYNLPAIVNGLEAAQMGRDAYEELIAAATWTGAANMDALINLDHPDVRAVL